MKPKKLLCIANLLHASPRLPGISNFLSELGYEITILTPPLGKDAESRLGFPPGFLQKVKLLEADYPGDVFWFWRSVLKKFGYNARESLTEQVKERFGVETQRSWVDQAMRTYQTVFAYPDTERTWRRFALKKAKALLEENKFDFLLSSSPFPTSHLVAAKLKKDFGLSWIADFRDTWTENPVYDFPELRKKFERGLELRTIASADAIVTVSKPYAEALESLHGKKVEVIPNGYTPLSLGKVPVTQKFTLSYTGNIYLGKQDPAKFLRALASLIQKKKIDADKIEVRFYGRRDNWLTTLIQSLGLEAVVIQKGTIDRIESRKRQMESQLLLFFNWEDKAARGLSHLKLYEYLASERPILACGGAPTGDDLILTETGTGVYAWTEAEIEKELLKAYESYLEMKTVPYSGDPEKVKKYSYECRAREFAAVLSRTQ